MFRDSDGTYELRKYENLSGRSSCSSGSSGLELALAPSALGLATAESPFTDQINLTNQTRTPDGRRMTFVSDTQSVHYAETFKDVGLMSSIRERMRRILWNKRVAFCAVLAVLTLCGVLTWALTGRAPPLELEPQPEPEPDLPLEWNITRSMWGANPQNSPIFPLSPSAVPLRLVVIQHTARDTCSNFEECVSTIRALQDYYLSYRNWDVPYNYMVGNDGRVYEGRGWAGGAGAHTLNYNGCSFGIGFMGNYWRVNGNSRATALQLNRTLKLLEGGVRDGMLHPSYIVVAASDLRVTNSPGDDLYDALRQWPHFNVDRNRFLRRNCSDIYAELIALDNMPPSSAIGLSSSCNIFCIVVMSATYAMKTLW